MVSRHFSQLTTVWTQSLLHPSMVGGYCEAPAELLSTSNFWVNELLMFEIFGWNLGGRRPQQHALTVHYD
jgi:hypothetical protein